MSTTTIAAPSGAESLKRGSRGLRGDVALEIAGSGRGGVSEAAYSLLKFHGTYEQFDRDTATARKQAGDDKEWQFMVRVRAPGGTMTAAQFLALDAIADRYSNGTMKITTRQGIQFHGTLRRDLKAEIAAINQALLTTYAACGDVVRNVMTTPAPVRDAVHDRLRADAQMLSDRLLPVSRGYYEIFLDEQPVAGASEADPVYGDTYLPRKFKIGLVDPSDNTVDLLANDLGFAAVWEDGELRGYDVFVGGGQGMTHNNPATFPRVAEAAGFVAADRLWEATLAVIALQKDHGDRSNRRRARLKYVVADRGIEWVRNELRTTYGLTALEAPRALPDFALPELLGWHAQGDGRWWVGVPVDSGRIEGAVRAALREIVVRFGANPVMTPQQDVLLSDLRDEDRVAVDAVLAKHGIAPAEQLSPVARWALACTALPFCGLALTEAERARGPIVAAVEEALQVHGMRDERLSLRVAGCPNGCSRPYTGDIGLVGRVPGQYALFVGGDFEGTRLSFKLQEKVKLGAIRSVLEPLFGAWAAGRRPGEGFGNFCARLGEDALHALLPAEQKVAA